MVAAAAAVTVVLVNITIIIPVAFGGPDSLPPEPEGTELRSVAVPVHQLAPREQWAATSPMPDFCPAEGGRHLGTGGKRQVLPRDPAAGPAPEAGLLGLLLLTRRFASPSSSVEKHPGSSHLWPCPRFMLSSGALFPGTGREMVAKGEKRNSSKRKIMSHCSLPGNAYVLEGAGRMQQPNRRQYARKASKT